MGAWHAVGWDIRLLVRPEVPPFQSMYNYDHVDHSIVYFRPSKTISYVTTFGAWGLLCFICQDSGEEASIALVDPCPSDQ